MTPCLRISASVAALLTALVVHGQNIVFNAALSGDALNPTTYPAVTSTTTGWQALSNKASPNPTESGGVLTLNMAATSSGFFEAQALFSASPVQLLPGTNLEVATTFVPANVLTAASDNFIFGLYNSGGSAPLAGLTSSGLSNALTTFATGGAKGWVGYNANIPISGSPKMVTRPGQTGANNTVQDVVVDSQSSSVGYTTPSGVSASSIGAFSTAFTSGSTYTVDYKLSLSADGLTLTAAVTLYNGAGTSGTGANTVIGSYTGKFSGATMLTKSFDALAFGWRADASLLSNIKISALKVTTTGGAPWVITQAPASLLVSVGSDLNLNTVVGGQVSSYQWQISTDGGASFVNIDTVANPSAATASLTLTNVQFSNQGIYRLQATNAAGTTLSATTTVTVSATPVAPTISISPASATVLGGTNYTLGVTVNGTSPFSYQWLKSTDGVTFAPIAGATNATYTLSPVSLADEGYYEVMITNVAGSATSAAAQLTVNQPLTITTQPVGGTVNQGGSFTLSAVAVGKPAPTYQWYLNGAAISGATNASYTFSGATGANGGIYTVIASNSTGDSVTSGNAEVAVLSPTLNATAMTPTSGGTNLDPDTRLTLTFNQPVAVGQVGRIRIYDTANATTPVDTIDVVAGNAAMKTLRAGNSISTQALPVQVKTIGGSTNFNYYPITVAGNTATIYPRNNVLAYGKTYYVTVDAGVFTDSTGLAYAGVTDSSTWRFRVKTVGPASGATQIVVAADGSGDFCTVQGALDFIPSGNTTPRTLFIRKGTYFEEIYFTGKHALTFLGEDRTQTVIAYPNNNNFNNVSGTYHRMVLEADKVNNAVFVNLTVQNTTPKGGAQAEALILNGTTTAQAIVSNVDLFSYQDTFQANGQAYITDSHISGDVDYMWGGGPNFLNNCRLTALSSGGYFTQIRNGSTGHGNTYLNCTLDGAAGVTGMSLARIDPSVSGGFPYSEVVWLNCVMGSVSGTTYSTPVSAAGWLLNNTPDQTAASAPNVHFWEYNSHYTDGTPLNVAGRIGASKQLTLANDAATITNYSTPAYVLGNGWTPQFAPIIATQPTAQTINQGTAFTLSVQAFGLPAVTYQWQRDGVAITGATNAVYTVPSSGSIDAGTYSVVVSNGVSSVTSSVVPLVVHGAAPVIARQPTNTAGLLGTTATLNVWALGDGPLAYQWSKDGNPIAGATGQSLRLTGLQSGDAGNYSVVVSNAGGATASATAALGIVAPASPVPTLPVIPAVTFDVTAYGAVGDGASDNTTAIQAAINAAAAAGGGTVEIPAASAAYLCGPITLTSNIDFQVDGGAMLQALPFGTYPRSTTAPAHFITVASGSSNVEFSGGGVIDGNGAAWWAAFNAGTISSRPRLVQLTKETAMLFTGVTFQNSPNFHLAFSGLNNNVTLYGVTISSPGDSPNTDGMDVAGTNFLIQGCSVADGDDNIVAKPGSVFCRNITIANCAIGTGHGVSIGGQTNVGLDGMVVTNCTFNGTSSALRFKADPTQGGPVQNVTFSNLTMTNVQYPILFYSYYNQLGSPGATSGSSQITPAKVNAWNVTPPNSLGTSTMPSWKNVTITNLTVTNGSGYSTIWGLPTADGLIANITLNNVTIQGGAGLELYDAANIQLTGVNSVGPIITCNALAITGQPVGKSVNVGDSVSLSASAVGGSGTNNQGLTYQWSLNGTPLTDGLQADGATISGSQTATITVTNARVTEAGNYTVTVATTLDGYNVATSSLAANSLPVTATSSAAALVVNPLPASIAWSNLTFTYDGSAKAPTVTTTPANVAVSLAYDGGTVPVNAGSYGVTATIADPNYVGAPVTATLTIAPAPATVQLSNLAFVYDVTAKAATVTTSPVGLSVQVTYNNDPTAPVNAGSYAIVATITDPNYTGSSSDTLVISPAMPVLTWNAPAAITYGTALGAGQLNATANVPGSFNYSPAAGTVLNAGSNQTLSVTFTPADTVNYANASATTLLTVNKANAIVTLAGLTQPYDGLPKTVQATTVPAGLTVIVTYAGSTNGPFLPGQYAVVATINDPNYVGSTTGTLNVTITALVRHAPTLNGGIDGSIQVLSGENISLNGTAWISGDLLVPGTPSLQLNGLPTIAGSVDETGTVAPSNYTVTLNGHAVLRYLLRRVDPLALAPVASPAQPTGTRNVTLNAASDNPGSFTTIRNLTLNGNAGTIVVPAGTYGTLTANGSTTLVLGTSGAMVPDVYNLQGLTLNGSSRINVVGPVLLILANGVTVNGALGDATHAQWLTIALASGGLTLNGNATAGAYVIAPAGAVVINGGSTLTGEVMADRLVINGQGQLIDPAP